jgi:CobQ-like glutamine amidotransferase family enzyme
LHGALLPKNPKLTDWLIEGGLHRRYGKLDLPVLNDELEDQAHVTAVARARVTR